MKKSYGLLAFLVMFIVCWLAFSPPGHAQGIGNKHLRRDLDAATAARPLSGGTLTNLTITGASSTNSGTIANTGTITGGNLAGSIANAGTITGGTISAPALVGAAISGSTTNSANLVNTGTITGGSVTNAAIQAPTITSGSASGFTVTNSTIYIGAGIKIECVTNNVRIITGTTTNHSYFTDNAD